VAKTASNAGNIKKDKYPAGDQHLSESEMEVMDVIWDSPEPLTTNDIHGEISVRRRTAKREIASFTTIDSIVRRLIGRGMITIEKRPARVVVNSPRLTRAQYAGYAMNYISDSVLKRALSFVLPRLSGVEGGGKTKNGQPGPDDQEVQQLLDTISDLSKH
jgi:predicted transcriptional regulator